MTVERKAFAFDIKSIDESGSFVGFASVYGNLDHGGDVVERGAFTKSMQERGTTVPILWQHDQKTPIGLGVLEDSNEGLKISGKLSLGVQQAKDAHELLKDRVVKGLSIGYDVVKQNYEKGARHLRELKLYEVSVVTFPMNEAAMVARVKAVAGDPEEAAELIAYQSIEAALEAASTALDQMQTLVGELITDETESPTETPEAEAAEEAVETARLKAILSAAGQIASAMYAAQGTAYALLRSDEPCGCGCGGTMAKPGHEHKADKAGARHSTADQNAIQSAHDSLIAAGAKCAEKAHTPSTSKAEAAPASAEPDLLHSLRALNDTLRPATGAAA
jgi:HK97 family phage prohead protease